MFAHNLVDIAFLVIPASALDPIYVSGVVGPGIVV